MGETVKTLPIPDTQLQIEGIEKLESLAKLEFDFFQEKIDQKSIEQLNGVVAELVTNLTDVNTTTNSVFKPAIQELATAVDTLVNTSFRNMLAGSSMLSETLNTNVVSSLKNVGLAANQLLSYEIPNLNNILEKTNQLLGVLLPDSARATVNSINEIEGAFFSLGSSVIRVNDLLLGTINNAGQAAKEAADASAAIAQSASGMANAAGSGGGNSVAGGRSAGGPIKPGMYRINEHGSEVLIEKNKMFLLSSGYGKIEPLEAVLKSFDKTAKTLPSIMSSYRPSTSSTVNNQDVTFNEGDITINVSVPNTSAPDIARHIREELTRQRSAEKMEARKILRSNQQ